MKEMKRSGQAWLGDIPKEWDYVPLKAIFNRRTQKNNPIISTERLSLSIDKGITLYADKTTNLDRFKDDFTQYQLAYPGDIVLNCMNMIVGAIGLSRYFGCVSPIYYVIYPVANNTNVDYYNYLLNISSIKDLYRSLGQGIYAIDRGDGRVNTCRLKVSYDDFGKIRLPLPSTKEQQAIADFLDVKCAEVDELIALQERMIDELKVYKQSVITEAVTKGLNPDALLRDSGIEWIGQIPMHWKIVPFKTTYRLTKGLTITKADLVENGVPVISYGQIHSKLNTGTNISDSLIRYVPESFITDNSNSLVCKGDIIFADTSEDLEGCGNCVYIDRKMVLFAGYHTIIAKNTFGLSSKYIAYLFKTDCWRYQLRTSVNGVKLFSISQKILANTSVILPSEIEQQQIADYLDTKCAEIDEMTSIKQQKIEQLKEYKKSIIYEYVTGKKQVNIE